jgi:uncharacterized membrane protein
MFDLTHIHPMIVHFPIALLIVGFLADIVGMIIKKDFFNKAGFYLLILGTLGVIAAYISGDYAGDGVVEAGSLGQALELHESAAMVSLWLMVGTALVRIGAVLLNKYNGIIKILAFILFFVGVLSIARTGYYGGELVFKHAAGVELNLGMDFNNTNELQQTEKTEDND